MTAAVKAAGGSTVWKFPLPVDGGYHSVQVPIGGQVVSVHAQTIGEVAIWAVVDPAAKAVPRTFVVTGTGHLLPSGMVFAYMGTAHVGPAVWHVWEVVA